jgi:hypothetical protein
MKKIIIVLVIILILYNLFFKSYETFFQEDKISILCRNSLDFYNANKDLCKEKIGSECSVKPHILNNGEACRLLGKEPCEYYEYLEKHKDECKAIINPTTNKPYNICSFEDYFKENKNKCRNEGTDACNYSETYLKENIQECRLNGTDICSVNKEYLLNNSEECRKYGFEPCNNQEFRYNKTEECINNGFNVCLEKDFLKTNKAIICSLGKEGVLNDEKSPCGYTEFLNINESNLDLCCSKGKVKKSDCKNVDPCLNESYLLNNPEECRTGGVEPCEISLIYKINNPIECRDRGFDPCKNKDYLLSNLTECKSLNFNPCNYFEYRKDNQNECNSSIETETQLSQ